MWLFNQVLNQSKFIIEQAINQSINLSIIYNSLNYSHNQTPANQSFKIPPFMTLDLDNKYGLSQLLIRHYNNYAFHFLSF